MTQQVVITTEATVELKPLIESAIQSEIRMLEVGLARTQQRLQNFETQYHLSSDEFERAFENGEFEETLDSIEWAGEIKTYRLLETYRQTLQGVRLN